MKRLPLFLIFAAALIGLSNVPGGSAGFSIACVNDSCRTTAQSSILAICAGLGLGFLVYFLPRKTVPSCKDSPVGLLRRLGALYIDMFVSMMPVAPILAMPVLLIEAQQTGEFRWSFYREFTRSSDAYAAGGAVLAMFGILFLYHFLHLVKGRATFGQYLLGYEISDGGLPWTSGRALKRIGLALLTLSIWPVSIFAALTNKDKAFWFDQHTNSLPRRVLYEGEVLIEAAQEPPAPPVAQYGPRQK